VENQQYVKLTGLRDGYLVEYQGDNPEELSTILAKYLQSYADLLQGHNLFVKSSLDEKALITVGKKLSALGFRTSLVKYEEKQKENKKEMMYGNASRSATGHRVTAQDSKKKGIPNTTGDVVFRVVVGPLRSGKSINLGEGVLLWGDLHKDAVIKALCVIVMGKASGKVIVPEGSFVLMKQSEGASVQVGDVLYVDISSPAWILITDADPDAVEVFSDEKQVGRRMSQWLGSVL